MNLCRFVHRLARHIHDGFFGRTSAVPFGLLRITWAITAFVAMVHHWAFVRLIYSDQGVFPPEWAAHYARTAYRFTILTYVHDPLAIQALFGLLLFSLVCMAIGYYTRVATIASVVLISSFQEHSYAVFAGGDSVLRIIGLILMISPGLGALSLDRLFQQERAWLQHGTSLPRLTMPQWPRLALIWQIVVLYLTAAWFKLLDPMWRNGSGMVASMNHAEFARFGEPVAHFFAYFSVPLSWLTISWQLTWIVFLIPLSLRRRLPARWHGYRRWMLAIGVVFHLMILILLDAGIFSMAMFATYFGVLDQDDYDAIRDWINRQSKWEGKIAVLYDGHCSFCRRTVLPLLLGDWLQRLELVDFHQEAARQAVAPDIALTSLDEALHVRLPDGRTAAGFDALRRLAPHLPWLWPLIPLLWIPGIAPLGRIAYRKIAANRYCLIGGRC